ncbi:hypothetical protein HYH03_006970 [Edaphochlamys debaryana]|uniref:peptidylprolyl isomerase n=1 Tax=Edaphochlamys debaryana TaxID=47281 RepID=A0A835Y5D6_9CHLO|nr:hypothetical protein HYH03_006970 [Edaphochlamys debaryana]|eukprot:KAG2495038.1 hypothetical protein HYH03_006970 [Edaphochlamys debaryana]
MAKLTLALVLAVAALSRIALAEEGGVQIDVKHKPDTCETKAQNGDWVAVHYVGKLTDGTEFDSSYTRNDPIEFQLGAQQVIPGWEQGIQGMCVGEKRKLTIPPHLGYGQEGSGPIPGGATLIFDVDLVRITEEPQDSPQGGYEEYPGALSGEWHDVDSYEDLPAHLFGDGEGYAEGDEGQWVPEDQQ